MSSSEQGCSGLLALKNTALSTMKKLLDKKNEEEVRIRTIEKHIEEIRSNIKTDEKKIKNIEAELESEKRYLEQGETTLNTLQSSHDKLEEQVRELEEQLSKERQSTVAEKHDCDTFLRKVHTDYDKQAEIVRNIKDNLGISRVERTVESLKERHTERTQYLQSLQTEVRRLREHKNDLKTADLDLNQFIVQLVETKLNTEKMQDDLNKEERKVVSLQATRDKIQKQKEHEECLLRTRNAIASSVHIPALPKLRRFEMPPLLSRCSFLPRITNSVSAPQNRPPQKKFSFQLPALKPFNRSQVPATFTAQEAQRMTAVPPKSNLDVQSTSNLQQQATAIKMSTYISRQETVKSPLLLKRPIHITDKERKQSQKKQRADIQVQEAAVQENQTSAPPESLSSVPPVTDSVNEPGSPVASSSSMSQTQYLALLKTASGSPENGGMLYEASEKETLMLRTTSTPKANYTTASEDTRGDMPPTPRSLRGEFDIFAGLDDSHPQSPPPQFNMFEDTDGGPQDKTGGPVGFAFTFAATNNNGPAKLF